MDDAVLVRGFERFGNLRGGAQRLGEGQRALLEPVGEVDPLHQLHHQRLAAVGVFQAIHGGDRAVAERGQHVRLALEPGHALGVVGVAGA